ncbi:succinate semialdehyde dehydrogenase [Punctularia strigosozonata HHB-11173 SS5]|uniref:Succinate semialdehyde dehydrogenase n=1 Tax=Punctularia strigosozonata (strain HHB-11173) TaxID=741275 RepID=R7S212_PUNST|nr:succinate semialdehyde dehydrogenase [Punctularia strigosozonata HHB-11173 SS5]EIN04450.1 succinate semialdehyde dehydrogenase [Punctularia strigosozonata HHB-11173 SS5]
MSGFSTTEQTTVSPHSLQTLHGSRRVYPSVEELNAVVDRASAAQKAWAKVPLPQRIAIGRKFMETTGPQEEFRRFADRAASELTLQMGRPISQTPGELRGMLDRTDYMLSIAESSLADVPLTDTDKPGFRRFIRRVPLGVVLCIAPWNYPYLTSVNCVIPALMAGNAVILKPSPQTPLTGERFRDALVAAGVPADVIQVVHLSPELTTHAIQHPLVDFVSFTGSVANGRSVEIAAATAPTFKGVALELGGKDPAYVRADADLAYTTAELVDGAMFNSGQSCCAVERIYVHESVFDEFVARFVEIVKRYRLDNPTNPATSMGPVVSIASAERIRKQVADAVAAGAKTLIPESHFPMARPGNAFVAPQVLVDVDHSMDIMKASPHNEETFGPVVGIMKVSSDEEAVHLMNDSPYGLTASVWTNAAANPESQAAFLRIEEELQAGTIFLNRCDYLDPALAWTGVKNSGRGVSLSKFGYDQLTRAKSVHMKIQTS